MPDASLGGRDTHTIRQALEAIRDRHHKDPCDPECCNVGHCICGLLWNPCADYSDAVAALAQLDASEAVMDGKWLNPDPPMRFRYVPDPVAGSPGAPRSNT